MPADEVTHGADAEAFRGRTGPRHAAPKKPLFTRFHMPAGRAIASVAMPTAVLMGMGFTASLAVADNNPSSSKMADEYKDCVAALEKDGKDASATPSPSASESKDATGGAQDGKDSATPDPSADGGTSGSSGSAGSGTDTTSSPDSGSGDKAQPTPSASASTAPKSGSTASAPTPSPSATDKNLLQDIGDALDGLLGGGQKNTPSPTATPTPSTSPSPSADQAAGTVKDTTDKVTGTVKDTTDKVTSTVKDTTDKATGTVKDTTDKVTGAAKDVTDAAQKAADGATASPSPSAGSTTDPADCKAATDAQGGVDGKTVADDPWYLEASSLLLKSADYQGVVEVKTASGTTKKVLKYVISGGTDIGDLHQTVKDKQSGKTYHVQAGKGTTSTIRDGDTVMYTESISGNLFGLIPITFSPDNPPPLNIPLIYFTHVKVVQAAQFGGTLTVPGMHLYTTD
ncbi:hypothetical protein AB0E88_19395 [Streptomyces sp. NPDC028635]|uniref:hypothetical protein n=1 Tax=Streptomyces sp. NPDC028635 TaxID=3154800 RepID=UPI0033D4ED0B